METSKLQRNLGEALGRVAAGETIELTRYGKVVAQLGPPTTDTDSTIVPSTSTSSTQADPIVAGSPEIRPRQESEPVRADKPGNWSARNTEQAERDRILGNMKKR